MALVLASASPQRRTILEQLGVEFTVVPADVHERTGGDPGKLVEHNAVLKARAVDGERVLGSDTAVAIDGEVLGKPADEEEARAFLRRLSGREHTVWSAVALVEKGKAVAAVDSAAVRFRALDASEIDAYVATGEWQNRAGGYAIQGRGAVLVQRVEGDYNCIVGLPVAALVGMAPHLFAPAC